MAVSRNEAKRLAAAAAARSSEDAHIRDAVRADAFVRQFVAMTPAQVAAYVDANVSDLASARRLLKRMALMLLLLARREYGDAP